MSASSRENSVIKPRHVTVWALDGSGDRAAGAELRFAVGGRSYGAATIGQGPARIQFEAPAIELIIEADYWGETVAARLLPGVDEYIFRFQAVARGIHGGPGTARCPDGTVGQPCVDCSVNGSTVRICA